jgi:hypothetical protein
MILKVTNLKTGEVWTEENTNHSWEKLALSILKDLNHQSALVYCDIEGLAQIDDQWYILDECGNWEYIPDHYMIEGGI